MKTLFTSPGQWLSVIEQDGYIYAERKGADSIGIIPIRMNNSRLQIFVHSEQNPAHYRHRNINRGAIGGSMDKGLIPLMAAKQELREEGGYDCPIDRIMPLGKMFATTQSSEHVYLFVADVTGLPYLGLDLEANEKNQGHDNKWVWYRKELFNDIEDPRLIVGLTRYLERTGICF